MPTLTYTQTLTQVTCWCGMPHAIPDDLEQYARRNGYTVYCPAGHRWSYTDTTEKELKETKERLDREQRRLQATRDLLAAEERSHSATRGVVTRQKNTLTRVKNGVCPCCNRTFQQLARHMANKHPEYAPEP